MPFEHEILPSFVEGFVNATCEGCGEKLVPVVGNEPSKYLQYLDALTIHFDGGYGEWFDYDDELDLNDTTAIFCEDCANALMEHPFFARFKKLR